MSENSGIIENFTNANRMLEEVSKDIPLRQKDLNIVRNLFFRSVSGLALNILDNSGFHQMDDAISHGELDPKFIPRIANALLVLSPSLFPSSMTDDVNSLRTDLQQLESALKERKESQAKSLASNVHKNEHQLHFSYIDWLSNQQVDP